MSKMTDDIFPYLLSFDSSKNWIKTLESEATREIYTENLFKYCKAIVKTPDELLKLKPKLLEIVLMMQKGNEVIDENCAETTLDGYLYNTPESELSVHLKVLTLSAVKNFYKANWRPLNPNVGSKLSLPESKKRTPKPKDVEELEEAMKNQRNKLLVWFLVSAPFRHDTMKQLLWKDLKPTLKLLKEVREEAKGQVTRTPEEDEELAKEIPYYLDIESARLKGKGRGKYKGVRQICFLNSFVAEKLEKYKQELREHDIVPTDDSPLFVSLKKTWNNYGKGATLGSLTLVFYTASLEAWHDLDNKMFSPQDFRNVLQSALERIEVNPNIIAPMLGHIIKGVDKHYSSHDIEELLLVYKKAIEWLIPPSAEKAKAEADKILSGERIKIANLDYENLNLKKDISSLNRRQQMMEQTINKMELFKLLTSEEDWNRAQEFFNTIRTEKIHKAEAEAEEDEMKKRLKDETPPLTKEQETELMNHVEECRRVQQQKNSELILTVN